MKRVFLFGLALLMIFSLCVPLSVAEEAVVSDLVDQPVDQIEEFDLGLPAEDLPDLSLSDDEQQIGEQQPVEPIEEIEIELEPEGEGEDIAISPTEAFTVSDVVVEGLNAASTASVGATLTAYATVTGNAGPCAYNYWLFDSTGTLVSEDYMLNTFESSMNFTVNQPGVYLMRVYATDFASDGYADGTWFLIEDASAKLQVSNVVVEGLNAASTANVGATLTAYATVTGNAGPCAYNYWLFDSTGTLVDDSCVLNTFETSVNFTVNQPGVYLMRIYATDFATDGYADGTWFLIEEETQKLQVSDVVVTGPDENGKVAAGTPMTATATVTGNAGPCAFNYWLFDSTGTLVDASCVLNTFETTAQFTVTEPGVYLMRIYATDFVTDGYADGTWFLVEESGDFVIDEVSYHVTSDTTVEVTGYSGSAAALTIPETARNYTVTRIGESAFENNATLTSIDLPDTVQVIGRRAFANCTSLSSMN